jgi:hypothetical protein
VSTTALSPPKGQGLPDEHARIEDVHDERAHHRVRAREAGPVPHQQHALPARHEHVREQPERERRADDALRRVSSARHTVVEGSTYWCLTDVVDAGHALNVNAPDWAGGQHERGRRGGCDGVRRLVPQTANERMDCRPGQRPARSHGRRACARGRSQTGGGPCSLPHGSEPIIGERDGRSGSRFQIRLMNSARTRSSMMHCRPRQPTSQPSRARKTHRHVDRARHRPRRLAHREDVVHLLHDDDV